MIETYIACGVSVLFGASCWFTMIADRKKQAKREDTLIGALMSKNYQEYLEVVDVLRTGPKERVALTKAQAELAKDSSPRPRGIPIT